MARSLLIFLDMGRPQRIQDHTLHYHIIVRCNNQEFHFEKEDDFQLYLNTLSFVQKKHQYRLFNYELMNSHVHLFLQPSKTIPLEKTMLLINWKYARDYNRRNKRKGHFWLDRYKSMPVDTDRYALALMRYMNRNPIRAGMVKTPGEWKWSGFSFYGNGKENKLIEPHPSYLALGNTDEVRTNEYRHFVLNIFPEEDKRTALFSDHLYIGSKEFGSKIFKNY